MCLHLSSNGSHYSKSFTFPNPIESFPTTELFPNVAVVFEMSLKCVSSPCLITCWRGKKCWIFNFEASERLKLRTAARKAEFSLNSLPWIWRQMSFWRLSGNKLSTFGKDEQTVYQHDIIISWYQDIIIYVHNKSLKLHSAENCKTSFIHTRLECESFQTYFKSKKAMIMWNRLLKMKEPLWREGGRNVSQIKVIEKLTSLISDIVIAQASFITCFSRSSRRACGIS